jgi:hypothetical protein
VGLERGPLSLVSTLDELLGRKSSGSGQESREYGRRDPSPINGGRSVGIVRSRTQATEFFFYRTVYADEVTGKNEAVLIIKYNEDVCRKGSGPMTEHANFGGRFSRVAG